MTEALRWLQRLCWLLYLLSLPVSYAYLPEQVGDAGKQLAKGAYLGIMLVASWPLPWLMCGSTMHWVRRHPSMLSLPYKAYWLAAERAEATWARLDRQLLATGWVIWVLMAGIHYQAVAGQQAGWPVLSPEISAIGVAAVVGVLLIGLWLQVRGWQVSAACWSEFQAQQALQADQGKTLSWQGGRHSNRHMNTRRSGHGQPR